MSSRARLMVVITLLTLVGWAGAVQATPIIEYPYVGITLITRSETVPRAEHIHVVEVDLNAPGLRFELTSPGGTLETVRQTTLAYLKQEGAQLAVNGEFFLPFPSTDLNALLIGLAASDGNVYSAFESPIQSYALVRNAPALNIDANNNASIVHADTSFVDGRHVLENVVLWNTVAGSAQIVTNGVPTIPFYLDGTHPDGLLTPGGPGSYSNNNSWYNLVNARTAVGLSQDNRTLVIFTVDSAGGSSGMRVGEVASMLINDYGVYNALNLDGGGATTLAWQDPVTRVDSILNVSSDNPNGRAVASNLAIFAQPIPEPPTGLLVLVGSVVGLLLRRRRLDSHLPLGRDRSPAG
jgi:exopolysaccharide biosynthesis protein